MRLPRTENRLLLIILVISLVIRLYYVYGTPTGSLSHDEIGYHEMTIQFLEKGFLGYYSDKPSAFVTPGYPLFLAAVYYVAGWLNMDPIASVRLVQVFISTISVYLVYLIAKSAAGRPAGYLAMVLWAIYPSALMANKRVLTEVLFIFFMLLYIYLLIRAFDQNSLALHTLSGAALAGAVLVRPAIAPFIVVPYLLKIVLKRDRTFIKGLVVTLMAFCLVMTPWWIRNYMVFDKFIMFATQSGNPLLRGADPYDPYDRIGPSIIEGVPESEMKKVAIERIREGLKNDPGLWIKWFTVGKFTFMWSKPWGVYSGWAKTLHLWVFVIMGWLGTILNLWNDKLRWPSFLIIFMTLIHMLFIPINRYMFPLMPLMAVMASILCYKIILNRLDTAYTNS